MNRATARLTLLLYLIAACAGCKGCREEKRVLTTPGTDVAIPRERAAYVTNNGSDTLAVFDRDGDDKVLSVPIDPDPDAHEAPHHIAVDGAGGVAFVALAFPPEAKKTKDPHASHGASSDAGWLARLDLGRLAVRSAQEVDENPGDVVLTHDKTRVLVTHYDMKRAMDVAAKGGASPATMFASLLVLDAKTLAVKGKRAVCVAPHGMAITRDDKTAFIACYGGDELAVVDLSDDALPTTRVPLGSAPGVPGVPRYGPYSATLSPDESLVVVADLEGKDVRAYDRAQKKLSADKTVTLDAKAFMPAFVSPSVLLVPTQAPDGLASVDLQNTRITKRVSFSKDTCALPHVVRVAKDGRVYLVCEGDHVAPGSVLEIDPATLITKKTWKMGVYPDGIAFGDD